MRFVFCGLVLCFSQAASAYELPPASTPVPQPPNVQILKQVEDALASISGASKKALVFISVSKTVEGVPQGMVNPFEFFFGFRDPRKAPHPDQPKPKQEGVGSGFFVDLKQGYILTNNHVVEGAEEILIKVATGKKYAGKIVGRDPQTDVAVVRIKDESWERKGLGQLVLADSDKVRVGDFAIALGAPFRLEASATFGVISAVERGNLQLTQYGNFIQTDAAINPGNSGGPLLNSSGKVIGINGAILTKAGAYNGAGFAIPANFARTIAHSLINEGSVTRGFLGVEFEALRDEWVEAFKLPKDTQGMLVASVVPDGPAAKAGLQKSDVLVAIDGKSLQTASDLSNGISLKKPGDKANLTLYRSGKKRDVTVTIGAWPGSEVAKAEDDAKADNDFGLLLGDIDSAARSRYEIKADKGVLVTGTVRGSVAAQSGLREGDVVTNINGTLVSSVRQADKLLSDVGKVVVLHVERRGQPNIVPLSRPSS